MPYEIQLGTPAQLSVLYSYPNNPKQPDELTLAGTIENWVSKSLARDGLAKATAKVRVESAGCSERYVLELDGPAAAAKFFPEFGGRLQQFHEIGWSAHTDDVTRIQAGKTIRPWDPTNDGWRFFMCHGLPLVNPLALQFFHYPPIRLLWLRDYLNDPVPHRVEDLLMANGVATREQAQRYERVMDATPIGASDDQGGLETIPIDDFYVYQAAQTRLFLNVSATHPNYTIPIVVYGRHPKRVFSKLFLYDAPFEDQQVTTAQILPGKTTAVLGSKHPYAFYGQIQGGNVGCGAIVQARLKSATKQMVDDLIVARWTKIMADDPSRDPADVLHECTDYWQKPAQKDTVSALVEYQGSLFYPSPDDPDPEKQYSFVFKVSLKEAQGGKKAPRTTGQRSAAASGG